MAAFLHGLLGLLVSPLAFVYFLLYYEFWFLPAESGCTTSPLFFSLRAVQMPEKETEMWKRANTWRCSWTPPNTPPPPPTHTVDQRDLLLSDPVVLKLRGVSPWSDGDHGDAQGFVSVPRQELMSQRLVAAQTCFKDAQNKHPCDICCLL